MFAIIFYNMALRIESILKEKGITKAKLADMLEIKPSSVSSIMNGNPTLNTLQKVALVLDVPFMELFDKEEPIITVQIDGKEYTVEKNIIINIKRK